MKELSIKEKAERYDEALERARIWKDKSGMPKDKQGVLDDIFPELKESEDERIRKTLINGFNKLDKSAVWYNGITNAQVLDWLEKQANHANFRNKIQIGDKVTRNRDGYLVNLSQLNRVAKPAAKVEPKFKIGDWITDGNITVQIEAIKNDCYLYCGDCVLYSTKTADKVYHLWTIQDTKDGDVLAYNDGSLTIFRYRLSGLDAGLYMSHVLLTDKIEFKQTCAISNSHPATQEQRDALMKAMADAGYEWSDKDRKLIKIVK